MLVSKTQAQRALLGLRRNIRDSDLANAVGSLEGQLEHRYGSFFPLNSLSRGNKDLIDILRQGTRGNRYRLNGQRLLEGGSLSEVDELDWSQNRPLLQIVLEIADMADTCYALRGRNGSLGWGMMSRGFSRTAMSVVESDEPTAELLTGQLYAAAADLVKQAEAALAQPDETPAVTMLRQEFYWLADRAAPDSEFGWLLTAPDHGLLTQREAAALTVLMSDPLRPRRCSWEAMAADKLGIRPNAACADGWPPKPDLRVVEGLPTQRIRTRVAARRKLAATA